MSAGTAILFVHGINTDDRDGSWRTSLDQALRREGTEALEERGYRLLAPTYLDLLEADTAPKCEAPETTYVKCSPSFYARAGAEYWSALARLERAGLRDSEVSPGIRGSIPTGTPASDVFRKRFFAQAERYRRSRDLRSAILTRVLEAAPPRADLVIIGHSLGSVVAADLIYHLDPTSRVRLLITLGSPLAFKPMRDQLAGHQSRFPFETIGAWVNLVGINDFVTGFRGLSQIFPESLDLFVDTGSHPQGAHSAARYMDQPAVARALGWLDHEQARHSGRSHAPHNGRLPDLPLPDAALAVLVGSQYALRAEQAQKAGDRRTRFAEARRLVLEDLSRRLTDAGFEHPVLRRLLRDNGAYLRGGVPPSEASRLLLSAHLMNPVAPFEIELEGDVRRKAREDLARDVGVPSSWATCVITAEKEARDVHGGGLNWLHVGLAAAGVAAIIAMPMLVLAAAPAGLAGGAAIVAGLAALGPGGMLGGVGIVGLLGGAGGAVTAVSARTLIAGSAAQVEETVIHLQALARVQRDLKQDDGSHAEWYALIAMEDVAADEHARLRLLADRGAPTAKELERKLKSIQGALVWLRAQSLSPGELGPGDIGS